MTSDPHVTQARLVKLALIGVFLATIGLIGVGPLRRHRPSALDLAALGLASYRIGHMLAFERVAEPLRAPVTASQRQPGGGGETVVPRGEGARQAVGELVTCPICVGTWAALALYVGLGIFPGPTRVLINVLAATGVAHMAHAAISRLQAADSSEDPADARGEEPDHEHDADDHSEQDPTHPDLPIRVDGSH